MVADHWTQHEQTYTVYEIMGMIATFWHRAKIFSTHQDCGVIDYATKYELNQTFLL